MTGPEHYELAQEWLQEARDAGSPEVAAQHLLQAQVHATLALAAASGLRGMNNMPGPDFTEWKKVAGRPSF